ncbi:OmpA family protein [Roseomonas sp. GC11]|uniref:OmpA family protein n=1 Tax=Roseomonas sp. GC11 TaxID=2950546 RepID=UPI0021094CAF|nr:OmpA family protein [Roseomonas sp. GC11]MCQ4160659.1 OmpA family protein [Roseomonas sp. GC11]
MTFRNALLAATLLGLPLLSPLAAQAQTTPVTGVYIGAGGGVNFLQESDLDTKGGAASFLRGNGVSRSGTAEFSTGFTGVLALGYGFGNGVRAEIEGNYRQNDVDKLSGYSGFGRLNSSGTARSYGAMFNAYYDFHQLGWPVVPYIGAGAGYVWNDYDNVTARAANGGSLTVDGSDGQFAYQGIVGASLPITAVPGLAVTAEYRFLGTLQSEIDSTIRLGNTVQARGKTEVDSYNHSIMLGLRYAFNQPVPPAPVPVAAPVAPAAAPAPARTYLVFFDFDRADLTDRARQIIAEAAQNAGRVQATRIEVAGHADRSGTPQYNQRLSQRRAEAVAAELVRLGVARTAITVQAFGESRPLVPTADGVREPQNRRVEIVLR